MSSAWDSDDELSCSSESSFDEDDVNHRVRPHWPSYLSLFKMYGIRLDTLRDVKEYYHKRGPDHIPASLLHSLLSGCVDDDALCPDYGLVCVWIKFHAMFYTLSSESQKTCSGVP